MIQMFHGNRFVYAIILFHLSPNMLGIGRGGLHVKIPRFAFCVTILANGTCAVWLSPRSILQTPPTACLLAFCFPP